jgi:hypothetical protein
VRGKRGKELVSHSTKKVHYCFPVLYFDSHSRLKTEGDNKILLAR